MGWSGKHVLLHSVQVTQDGGTFMWMCQSCKADAERAAVAADEDVDNRAVHLDVSTTDIGVPAFESGFVRSDLLSTYYITYANFTT